MIDRLSVFCAPGLILLAATVFVGSPAAAQAQRSEINVELHANKNITAANIGLPDFPSARAYTDSANESPVDLGFTFGDVHFRVLVSQYLTGATPRQVFDFYRKPLARYGDVLECERGEAIGPVKVARGGLTCSDSTGKQPHAGGSSTDHELRSGNPHLFRIVALDSPRADSTQFTLLLIELPKNTESGTRSK